jgi:hypothetical protein
MIKYIFALAWLLNTACQIKKEVVTSDLESVQIPKHSVAARFGMRLKKGTEGVVIKAFSKQELSPACVMGLELQDEIISLNGYKTGNVAEFISSARTHVESGYVGQDGESGNWCFTVKRNGQRLKLPNDCNWDSIILGRSMASFFTFCQPDNMYQCAPSAGTCHKFVTHPK